MELKLLLQIIGVALGLLYLWLEYKANILLWVIGLVMPIVHCALYFHSGLYADATMQGYYIAAGIYGLCAWIAGRRKTKGKTIVVHAPRRIILPTIAVYTLLHVAIYYALVTFTDSTVPFWDSTTTALSVVAMWLLSRRYVEQWLVWLVVDCITVGLYIYKGIPLTASLYAFYSALAVVGYMRWRRLAREQASA